MGVLAWNDAVDIGGGRGRLARDAAASLARVDAAMRSAFGRAADINEAWRSPEDADENYRKYLAYLRGGPWAPIALPGDQSVHCFGGAVDTDDTSDAQMRIWNDNGWFWTVYRNGQLAERWHLEYFLTRDNRRIEGAPASEMAAPTTKRRAPMNYIRITGKEGARRGGTYAVFAASDGSYVAEFVGNAGPNNLVELSDEGQIVRLQNIIRGLR